MVVPRLQTKPIPLTESDTSEITGLAVANMADVEAVLTLTAYNHNGSMISGNGITNPVRKTLPPGSQLATVDSELFGNGLFDQQPVGWIAVDSTIDDITVFSLMFNGSMSRMDGAPAERCNLHFGVMSHNAV